MSNAYIVLLPVYSHYASAPLGRLKNRLCTQKRVSQSHHQRKTDERKREHAKIHYYQFQKKNMVVVDVKRYIPQRNITYIFCLPSMHCQEMKYMYAAACCEIRE